MARGVGPNLGSRRRPDKRESANRDVARDPRRLDKPCAVAPRSGLVAHLAGQLGEEAAFGWRQALDPLGGDLVEDAVDFRLRGVALGAPRFRRRVAPAGDPGRLDQHPWLGGASDMTLRARHPPIGGLEAQEAGCEASPVSVVSLAADARTKRHAEGYRLRD